MPLTKMSPARLAANRANARLAANRANALRASQAAGQQNGRQSYAVKSHTSSA